MAPDSGGEGAGSGVPVTVSTTFQVLPAGDVTYDNVVNGCDASVVKAALSSECGDVKFNVDADVNGDGVTWLPFVGDCRTFLKSQSWEFDALITTCA